MKISGLVLLLIVLVAFAALFYQPVEKPAAHFHATDDDISFYKNTLASLTQENRELKNKIVALEQSNRELHAQLQQPVTPASTTNRNIVDQSPAHNLSAEQRQEMRVAAETTAEFTNYLGQFSTSSASIKNDLTKKFDAEPIDYSWASGHEQKIGKLFESQEGLSGYVPEGIICKTTRCQIKVPVNSFEESNQLMKALSQAIANNSAGLDEAMLLTAPDPESGFVDFYIGRDKNVKIFN